MARLESHACTHTHVCIHTHTQGLILAKFPLCSQTQTINTVKRVSSEAWDDLIGHKTGPLQSTLFAYSSITHSKVA